MEVSITFCFLLKRVFCSRTLAVTVVADNEGPFLVNLVVADNEGPFLVNLVVADNEGPFLVNLVVAENEGLSL